MSRVRLAAHSGSWATRSKPWMPRVSRNILLMRPLLGKGLVDGSSAIVGPIAGLMKEGAELRVLLSAGERDGFAELTPSVIASRSEQFAGRGLRLVDARWASSAMVAETRSAWAKRLGPSRPVVFARYSRTSSRRGLMSAGTSPGLQGIHSTRNLPS